MSVGSSERGSGVSVSVSAVIRHVYYTVSGSVSVTLSILYTTGSGSVSV